MEQSGQGTRFLLLTGAPRSEELSWTDADLTVELQPCFQQSNDATTQLLHPPSSAPSWRELNLIPKSFHSGFSQHHFPVFYQGPWHHINEDGSNSTGSTLAGVVSESNVRESYMTRSLSLSAVESFLSASSGYSQLPDPLPLSVRVTDLSNLPTANHLEQVPRYGQSLVNLLGVVLAVSNVQSLKTRNSAINEEAELIRLVIADDTRTDFELSLWLDRRNKTALTGKDLTTGGNILLREAIENLQTHDIVLFQNMALRVFQNRVSASSVRGLTSIKLLCRDHPPAALAQASWYSTKAFADPKVSGTIPGKILKILQWRDKFLETPISLDTRSESDKIKPDGTGAINARLNVQLPADAQ